jgi:hypothetical protein
MLAELSQLQILCRSNLFLDAMSRNIVHKYKRLSLCLVKPHAKKKYGTVEAQLHALLTLVLVWSASHPSCFIPMERISITHWIGDWVGLRIGLEDVKNK